MLIILKVFIMVEKFLNNATIEVVNAVTKTVGYGIGVGEGIIWAHYYKSLMEGKKSGKDFGK